MMTYPMGLLRECRKCQWLGLLIGFKPRPDGGKFGRRHECLSCSNKRTNAYQKKRYAEDPEVRRKISEHSRKYHAKRRAADPEGMRQAGRDRMRKWRADPDNREQQNKRRQKQREDPAYRRHELDLEAARLERMTPERREARLKKDVKAQSFSRSMGTSPKTDVGIQQTQICGRP